MFSSEEEKNIFKFNTILVATENCEQARVELAVEKNNF